MRAIRKTILLLLASAAIFTFATMVVSFWTTLSWHGNISSSFVPPPGSRTAVLGISPWGGYAIFDGVLHVDYDGGVPLGDNAVIVVSPSPRVVTDLLLSGASPARPLIVQSPPRTEIDFAGVRAEWVVLATGEWSMEAAVPLWIPTLVLAVVPFAAFFSDPVRRWRRRKCGLCVRCAYDLTGNESGVCPECGIVIDKASEIQLTVR